MATSSDKQAPIQALLERLHWGYAERDDNRVAHSLVHDRAIDEVHSLSQGGLLDGFMAFLQECRFMDYLAAMQVKDCKRLLIPVISLMLTYMTKTLANIPSVYALPEILFSDQTVMRILGFNARLLEDGLTHRSHEKRSSDRDQPKPFSPQMLADFIGKINVREAERFFNHAITCLARLGVFQQELTTVIDGTDVETTDQCKGCGKRTKKKQVKKEQVTYLAYGFKAVALYDLATQLPIAVKVGKINRHDSKFTFSLLKQAEENLKDTSARVSKVLADRGFIDGRMMWRLNRDGIEFVCPAKKNMHVYKDAQGLAAKGEGIVQKRTRTITHGHGKNQTKEVLETEVVGITGLTSWDQYNDPSCTNYTSKDYSPLPINAVVVRKWDNMDHGPGGKTIYLTNRALGRRPLRTFDDYDNRSLIENTLFREGKQAWSLEAIPKKTQRAATAHIFITFAMVALTTAFRTAQCAEETQHDIFSSVHSEPVGATRWRRALEEQNRDRIIVFSNGYYGIFHIAEFTVLSGFKVRILPPEVGSAEDIHRRYGVTQE